MNDDEFNEQDAINSIQEIVNIGEENGEQLLTITQQLNDINNHITNIDEFVIQLQEEKKKNEQETKEITKETTEKDTKDGTTETEETITNTEIYEEIIKVNDNLEIQNNILTVGIFSQGILIGVLLLTLFWKRVFR